MRASASIEQLPGTREAGMGIARFSVCCFLLPGACHTTLSPGTGMASSVEDKLQMQLDLCHVAQLLLNTGYSPVLTWCLATGPRQALTMFVSDVCCPQPGTAPTQASA